MRKYSAFRGLGSKEETSTTIYHLHPLRLSAPSPNRLPQRQSYIRRETRMGQRLSGRPVDIPRVDPVFAKRGAAAGQVMGISTGQWLMVLNVI
jgi:hypothetical protein